MNLDMMKKFSAGLKNYNSSFRVVKSPINNVSNFIPNLDYGSVVVDDNVSNSSPSPLKINLANISEIAKVDLPPMKDSPKAQPLENLMSIFAAESKLN